MKILPLIVLVLCLGMTTSCNKDDDTRRSPAANPCPSPFCGVEPTVVSSGLEITFLNHELEYPKSKYSVFFKLDQASNPVTNLTVDDVVVKDNGQVIEFESANELTPDPQSFGFHIALIVDLSESVTESAVLPQVKEAMAAFVNTILVGSNSDVGETFVAIYYFDGDPDLVALQNFTQNSDELLSTIDNISADLTRDNSTNLNGAFISGASIIKSRVNNSPKLVDVGTMVVFTDGSDLAGLSSFEEASVAVQGLSDGENQIDVYTIGLGQSVDNNVLQQLGYSGYYPSANFTSLTPTFEDIAAELNAEVNSYYKLEYCSPRRAGQTEIIIEINKNNVTGRIESCINSDCTPDPC
ncbi:VWA domain-containing protein [Cryomorpha ignava]|uniref:VWA domain-containing protein n=1 Tax=Cryomorpha ignava TaxID=101383 RepID=A0A7K3WS15_9FLAO|nr:vWA domain-containing protein [Cryomorpha ignava]NEN24308.1 VWA domain-containing protein [Cryomorpha ignava]